MKRNIFLSLLVAVLFSLTFGAATSRAGERDGITDKEILIGGAGPITGAASNLGPMVLLAGKLATKQINEAGGINGRKIKYLEGDETCVSSGGLAIAKKMISSDKVFAFHGFMCSHVVLAIRPLLEKEQVPLITWAQGSKILEPHSKYIFRSIPPTRITGSIMAKFMREYFPKKFTKVAIIYTIEEYGASGKDGLVAQLKKYDIEPVAVETHKIGDTDYSAQLLKIKGLNPEVIFLLSYSKDMGLILKQAHEIGLDCPKILYMGSDHPIIPSLAGKGALKEVYGPTNLLDAIRGGKLKSFIEMYEKEYPDYVKNPNNPSSSDVTSYVALQLLGEGLKRAGRDLTRTKFITAMESIKNFKSPWIPPMTFSATQHEGALQERFIKYINGKAEGLDFEIK